MAETSKNELVHQASALDLEMAYAQNALFDAEREAGEANLAYRTAGDRSKELNQRTTVAREAMRTILERAQSAAQSEYHQRVLDLFGVDKDTLSGDAPQIIELSDEMIEAYLAMEAEEYDRTSKLGAEIEIQRFGHKVHDREKFRDHTPSFVGGMVKAAAKMKPGTHFVRERNDSSESIAIVAGDDSTRSAARVVARITSGRRGNAVSWGVGIIVPVVGEEEPAEFFSMAPSFNIDHHIKELLDRHRELLKEPIHEVHPLDAIQLAGKLEQFNKKKLVKELRQLAEKSLVSVISGASYTTFPNNRTEAPQYSEERYIELLTELEKLGGDKLEAAIDARAERAVRFLRWQNDDVNPRPAGNYLGISEDTYVFVRGELLFRRDKDDNPEPITTDEFVDAMADFYKRGFQLKATKKAVEEAAAK
jgi:hypothetical protein